MRHTSDLIIAWIFFFAIEVKLNLSFRLLYDYYETTSYGLVSYQPKMISILTLNLCLMTTLNQQNTEKKFLERIYMR